MDTRRSFLKKCAIISAAIVVPGCMAGSVKPRSYFLKSASPRKALVFWYSQTGHTERYGKIIAKVFENRSLTVVSGDIRGLNNINFNDFDLIVAGSPVNYHDAPNYIKSWITQINTIDGVAVATYSSFGGHGNNQYNTACTLIYGLMEKGGIPVGIRTFGNMSTFAPTWSAGNSARTLKYKHLPDRYTDNSVAQYAEDILTSIQTRVFINPIKEYGLDELTRPLPTMQFIKSLVGTHKIDINRCVRCGVCVKKCPVGAIDPASAKINTNSCILCLGCVNNCYENAIVMTFMGQRVIGFFPFLKEHGISIHAPDILKT